MTHLEGVLTLVSDTGPWFRIQGRHIRPTDAKPVGLRLTLDPHTGITVDVHLGTSVWFRGGWLPGHSLCSADARCWTRRLKPRVYQHGLA